MHTKAFMTVPKREEKIWADLGMTKCSSVTQLCLTLCTIMDCSMPGFLVHHQLPEVVQTHIHPVGDVNQPSHPLSSPSPPALNLPQHQGLFNWVSYLNQYWSFSFSISPSNEHPGLISFRMDWLDLLAVQGTLKSPTPQFKRINFLALGFLYSPTLTSTYDYWKSNSLD